MRPATLTVTAAQQRPGELDPLSERMFYKSSWRAPARSRPRLKRPGEFLEFIIQALAILPIERADTC